MSTKSKKLSLSEYNKLDKQFNERKPIRITAYLPDGSTQSYDYSTVKYFKPTEVQKLTIDYLSLLSELQNNPDITAETLYNANSLLNALIVKYFSDVPIPKIDDVESVVKVSEVLFNLGIMDQLFDPEKGFSKSEIDKLTVQLDKQSKLIGQKFGELALSASFNETGVETDGLYEPQTT